MLDECAAVGVRRSVTARLAPLPAWKQRADRLFVQVAWSIDELLWWRDTLRYEGPVYAGVMVLPSAAMARRLGARVPELRVPDSLIDDLDHDSSAGVRFAARAIDAIRSSGAFAGVHLVAGARHRELAAELLKTPERTVPR
jgi:5,10-methylenetetrahydrofolate reductase